jgi:hypothetical protein
VLLLAALACLAVTAGSGILIGALVGLAYGWPILALSLFPIVAAGYLTARHSHAEGHLRLTVILWLPMVSIFLLPVLFGPAVDPRPDWWLPAVVAAAVGGVASLLALSTGTRHLRRTVARW